MFALIELYGRTVQSVYTNIYSQVQLWKYIIVSELKRNKFILVALLEVTLFRVYIFFITRQIISPNYLQKIWFFCIAPQYSINIQIQGQQRTKIPHMYFVLVLVLKDTRSGENITYCTTLVYTHKWGEWERELQKPVQLGNKSYGGGYWLIHSSWGWVEKRLD